MMTDIRAAIDALRSVRFDEPDPDDDRVARILAHVEAWRDNRRAWADEHPEDELAQYAAKRAADLLETCRWEAER